MLKIVVIYIFIVFLRIELLIVAIIEVLVNNESFTDKYWFILRYR